MAVVDVRGDIISNDDKWIYDWLEWEATCPKDIQDAISGMQPEEELTVLFNSGGGDVMAGQEIYSLLSSVNSVGKIMSFAASAAGVAAMGCRRVEISPVGMIMVHNVWCSGVAGDYHEMDKASDMLKRMNEAMANAYTAKSGRPREEILQMMEKETWLTAERALEYGFADEIIQTEQINLTNSFPGMRLTDEIRRQVLSEKERQDSKEKEKEELLRDLDYFGV